MWDKRTIFEGLAGVTIKNDWDAVVYRLDWYNFQFFQYHTIDLITFLKIIYQSWLQLAMIETNQDLTGPIFRKYGIYGTDYFVAFGGSADSRSKGDAEFSDRRIKGKCNTTTPPFTEAYFHEFGWDNARRYFVSNEGRSLETFLDYAFNMEAEFYTTEQLCKDKNWALNPAKLMQTLWTNPIGTLTNAFKSMKADSDRAEAIREGNYIKDLDVNVLNPLQANEEQDYKNQALIFLGVGLALVTTLGIVITRNDK